MGKEYDFQAAVETHGSLCVKFCKAACCRDVVFESIARDDLNTLTASARLVQQVDTPKEAQDIGYGEVSLRDGIYYAESTNGELTVGLVGPCPNLQPDSSCGVYDSRPEACRKFEVGQKECKSARKQKGLKLLEKVLHLKPIPTPPGRFNPKRYFGSKRS